MNSLGHLFARDRLRKKLTNHLSKAEDVGLLELVWVVDALQPERGATIPPGFDIPREARGATLGSPYALYKWELETLVNLLLVTPKNLEGRGKTRKLRIDRFQSLATVANLLREFENEESGLHLDVHNVLNEMHRTGHRQFPWQRGFFDRVSLYRYAFIYNSKECADYFIEKFGISIDKFILCGFACYGYFTSGIGLKANPEVPAIGISREDFRQFLSLTSQTIDEARSSASALWRDVRRKGGARLPLAYMPSVLRQRPIISDPPRERYLAPLPALIALRMTAGIYYDLANGPSQLRNSISARFETYCRSLIGRMMPEFNVKSPEKYNVGKKSMDTPDVRIEHSGELRIIVECKATKMTFAAQFGEDPFAAAGLKYAEIAKGVFQVWRYVSHIRAGYFKEHYDITKLKGLVLTLDNWLAMSRELQDDVLRHADALAVADGGISAADKIPVLFGSISDLEHMLAYTADAEEIFEVMERASDARFLGWLLPNIQRELKPKDEQVRPYPFDLGEVLPWWEELDEKGRARHLPR